MSARKVLVVMPFGGEDTVESRRSILNFKRLEYLIRNKCQVKPAAPENPTDRVSYAVEVARTVQENIPPWALDRIQTADIVIALVAGTNASVIYELAYRRTRGGELILVVDEEKNLPFYERLTGRCSWAQDQVLARIEKIAADSIPDLSDFSAGIPDDLKTEIDRNDTKLAQDLQNALQAIEPRFVPPTLQPSSICAESYPTIPQVFTRAQSSRFLICGTGNSIPIPRPSSRSSTMHSVVCLDTWTKLLRKKIDR